MPHARAFSCARVRKCTGRPPACRAIPPPDRLLPLPLSESTRTKLTHLTPPSLFLHVVRLSNTTPGELDGAEATPFARTSSCEVEARAGGASSSAARPLRISRMRRGRRMTLLWAASTRCTCAKARPSAPRRRGDGLPPRCARNCVEQDVLHVVRNCEEKRVGGRRAWKGRHRSSLALMRVLLLLRCATTPPARLLMCSQQTQHGRVRSNGVYIIASSRDR
ncbi:hypothetical protein OH77DRAFT_365866 [Trametes cingulata]|nr:hypothetical protein OH77DRAFT_365866 [Trametes cingulata]